MSIGTSVCLSLHSLIYQMDEPNRSLRRRKSYVINISYFRFKPLPVVFKKHPPVVN